MPQRTKGTLMLYVLADANATNRSKKTPRCSAFDGGYLDIMRLLLEHGAAAIVAYNVARPLFHEASFRGRADAVHLLLQHNACWTREIKGT